MILILWFFMLIKIKKFEVNFIKVFEVNFVKNNKKNQEFEVNFIKNNKKSDIRS